MCFGLELMATAVSEILGQYMTILNFIWLCTEFPGSVRTKADLTLAVEIQPFMSTTGNTACFLLKAVLAQIFFTLDSAKSLKFVAKSIIQSLLLSVMEIPSLL